MNPSHGRRNSLEGSASPMRQQDLGGFLYAGAGSTHASKELQFRASCLLTRKANESVAEWISLFHATQTEVQRVRSNARL